MITETENKIKQCKARSWNSPNYHIPNQWIVFFVRSDWLLKLGMAFVIHLPAFFWIWRVSFASFLKKKRTIWCWLSTGLVYSEIVIHLSVSEEW